MDWRASRSGPWTSSAAAKAPATLCRQRLGMELTSILRRAVELGASDVHLKLDRPPLFRRDGEISAFDTPPLTEQDLDAILRGVTAASPKRYDQFQETGDLDIAFTADDLPRFRVNAFRQRGAISFAMRVIPTNVPSFE